MEKRKVGVKMTMRLDEAVAHLENLLGALKSGAVAVQSGDEAVTLTPAPTVSVEVEAKTCKGKGKFVYELSWAIAEPGDLAIAAAETTPAPEAAPEPAGPEAPAAALPEAGKERKEHKDKQDKKDKKEKKDKRYGKDEKSASGKDKR